MEFHGSDHKWDKVASKSSGKSTWMIMRQKENAKE